MNKSAEQLSPHTSQTLPSQAPLTTSDAILIHEGSSRHSLLAKQTQLIEREIVSVPCDCFMSHWVNL